MQRKGRRLRDGSVHAAGSRAAAPDATALERVADVMLIGVVVLDANGVVGFANVAARRMLAARDGIEIARRRLRAASSSDQRRLGKAIEIALTAPGAPPLRDTVFSLSRPSAERSYPVHVRSVASGGALVLLGNPDERIELDPKLVAALYALTPAEARLACAFVAGESPESYAKSAGLTRSTVRWTLKQVQSKSGAHRQCDLVRLLLTGPAGVRPPDP